MAATDFSFADGERFIRFGEAAVDEAPALLASRGFTEYALLTTKRALRSAPALATGAAEVVDVPHGKVDEVAAGLLAGIPSRPVVALGGGRVVDTAKAIAGTRGLAVAAVPTTLSGAEMTQFHRMPAGVTEWRLVRPQVVVASPALMASAPMPGLAASAMNALAHAIEALYTPLANPVAELAALRSIELIGSGLRDDDPHGEELALGSLLAGYASGIAGFAVHHAVCQTIVREAGTPHAETNAVMLPHSVRLMTDRAPREIGLVAQALNADAAPHEAASAVERLARRAGVGRLGELGVDAASVPEILDAVSRHPALANTPHPPDQAELRNLLMNGC